MFVYITSIKPFKVDINNQIEIFNEICIMAIGYILIMFTDYVGVESRYNGGWALIIIIIMNLLVNTIIMIKMTFA
jgi:hypothetical protein